MESPRYVKIINIKLMLKIFFINSPLNQTKIKNKKLERNLFEKFI